jgi:hypothetical protein
MLVPALRKHQEAGYDARNSIKFEEGYEITFHNSEESLRNISII